MTPVAASLPWLGVNFWSRAGGPRMWSERYDAGVVREELAVLVAHGLDVTRSFCFWPDFVPEPEQLDDDAAARFADFLDAHLESGMRTIPTLLVGHMSGENWDPPWRSDRDLYRDVWLVSQQAWLAAELARRFGRHPAICGWLVSNEMPLYGGSATRRRDHRLGTDRRPGAQVGWRRPAGLARRRCLGHRGHGRRQRLLAPRARPARRLRRPALVPDAGRRAATGPLPRPRMRARRRVRPPGRARGVRGPVRLRLERQRRRVLRPGAPHDAARRRARLARLVQHRSRRAPRKRIPIGTTSSSSTSGSPMQRAGRRSSSA